MNETNKMTFPGPLDTLNTHAQHADDPETAALVVQALRQLEKDEFRFGNEVFMLRLLVRALIAKHPDPASVKTKFEQLFLIDEVEAADRGYARGEPAQDLYRDNQVARKAFERWQRDLDKLCR